MSVHGWVVAMFRPDSSFASVDDGGGPPIHGLSRRRMRTVFGLIMTACAALMACEREPRMQAADNTALPSLSQVTQEEWDRLASRTIYFGHQSVGEDGLAGVTDILKENPRIRLRIVRGSEAPPTMAPALVHVQIGSNGDPRSKNEAMLRFLDGARPTEGVVLFKYCYLDIDVGTDTRRVFEAYRSTVDAIKARHSGLRVVHITAPLTTMEGHLKLALKSVLGRATDRDRNVKRNQYNALLRAEFQGREPVFDLASLESTRPDGSRMWFGPSDAPVYSLAPELTSDGGHLNATGRRLVAERLLATLAKIP